MKSIAPAFVPVAARSAPGALPAGTPVPRVASRKAGGVQNRGRLHLAQ